VTKVPLARTVVERRQASAPDSGGSAQADSSWRAPCPLARYQDQLRLPAFRFLYVPEVSRKEFVIASVGEAIRCSGKVPSLFDTVDRDTRARSRRESGILFHSFPRKRESSLGPRFRGDERSERRRGPRIAHRALIRSPFRPTVSLHS
jgi:hypothetical protein